MNDCWSGKNVLHGWSLTLVMKPFWRLMSIMALVHKKYPRQWKVCLLLKSREELGGCFFRTLLMVLGVTPVGRGLYLDLVYQLWKSLAYWLSWQILESYACSFSSELWHSICYITRTALLGIVPRIATKAPLCLRTKLTDFKLFSAFRVLLYALQASY